jgi:hypothetical protein
MFIVEDKIRLITEKPIVILQYIAFIIISDVSLHIGLRHNEECFKWNLLRPKTFMLCWPADIWHDESFSRKSVQFDLSFLQSRF